jgi:hypothetical protein
VCRCIPIVVVIKSSTVITVINIIIVSTIVIFVVIFAVIIFVIIISSIVIFIMFSVVVVVVVIIIIIIIIITLTLTMGQRHRGQAAQRWDLTHDIIISDCTVALLLLFVFKHGELVSGYPHRCYTNLSCLLDLLFHLLDKFPVYGWDTLNSTDIYMSDVHAQHRYLCRMSYVHAQ